MGYDYTRKLELIVEEVINNDLVSTLQKIGMEHDNDLNGENGEEYLWSEAKGYPSNLDYLVARIKNDLQKPTHLSKNAQYQVAAENFVDQWLGQDSYYERYKITLVFDEQENVTQVVLAFSTADY